MANTIRQLPPPPSRINAPAEFTQRADALFSALPGFVSDANSLAVDVENKRNEILAQDGRLVILEQAQTQTAGRVESIELLLNAGAQIAEATDFMASTLKAVADNANNHLKLKFDLMQKGVI